MSAARLIAAAAAAGLLFLAQWLTPVLAGRLPPSLLDMAVGAAFAGSVVVVGGRGRGFAGAALALAAVTWAVSGTPALFPGVWAEISARCSLVPHALLVIVAVSLPSGRLRGPRTLLFGAAAVAVGIAAGAGVLRPAILALGIVAVLSAVRRWRGAASGIQIALGAVFIAVDVSGLSGVADPFVAAGIIDVTVIAATSAISLMLDDRRHLRLLSAAVATAADPFGSQLGRLLGSGDLQVAFPGPGDEQIDVTGRPVVMPPHAATFMSAEGTVIAHVSPAVQVDSFLAGRLLGILERAGDLARLRATQREGARALKASRRLLLRAADDERADLELRVAHRVGVLLDAVVAELDSARVAPALIARARAVREEVLRIGAAATVPAPHDLAGALDVLCRSAGLRLTASIDHGFAPSPALMRVVWFTCTEAIVNAAKHAPGAIVVVRVSVEDDVVVVVSIEDDGPGGADPSGSGLSGLADRAADAGARFQVTATEPGTRLELRFDQSGIPAPPTRDIHDVATAGAFVP